MSLAQALADYCVRVRYDDIPPHIRTYAKHAIIDQLGVSLRAAQTESPSTFVSRLVHLMGGAGEVRIFDSAMKVPLINAALANGAVAVGTALDGYHQPSATHLLALLVPVCVSVGEREATGGRDLITALVVAADVLSRVSKACGPSQLLARGFHPSSLCGPFGCAVAAGKLLGLEEAQMAHALALAGVQGAGLTVWGGEEELSSYALQIGRAAQSGVVAAVLARNGITGCPTIFEHTCGFFSSHAPEANLDELTRGLGSTFEIYDTTFCLYNFGVVIYAAADALLEILGENHIGPEDIARLSVGLPTRAMPLVADSDYPTSRGRAWVNIKYVLSVVAVLGERLRHQLDPGLEKWRRDPLVRSLFDKVSVYAEPSLDALFPALMPAVVEVKTDAGRTASSRFDGPTRGQPPHRLSVDEVMTKFRRNVAGIMAPARVDAILACLRELEDVDDVRVLSDQLFAG